MILEQEIEAYYQNYDKYLDHTVMNLWAKELRKYNEKEVVLLLHHLLATEEKKLNLAAILKKLAVKHSKFNAGSNEIDWTKYPYDVKEKYEQLQLNRIIWIKHPGRVKYVQMQVTGDYKGVMFGTEMYSKNAPCVNNLLGELLKGSDIIFDKPESHEMYQLHFEKGE